MRPAAHTARMASPLQLSQRRGHSLVKTYSADYVRKHDFVKAREGETRVWQAVHYLPGAPQNAVALQGALEELKGRGVRYVLLGVPEDVGPRANEGRGGADQGWFSFLFRFLNLQANRHFPGNVCLLGEVNCAEIQASVPESSNPSLEALRLATAAVDGVVEPVLKAVFEAGLEPIVIGGGHNNAYPILAALHKATGRKGVAACNLDPHADFRAMEGRHSGNGFRYAHGEGMLRGYHVVGLHEYKNNEAILQAMGDAGFTYDSYQRIRVRREVAFSDAVAGAKAALEDLQLPMGVEVDTDAISMMPVSAFTNTGLAVSDAEEFVYNLSKSRYARYLHLAEAAPKHHAAGFKQGVDEAGQVLAALVLAFITGRERAHAVRGYKKAVSHM